MLVLNHKLTEQIEGIYSQLVAKLRNPVVYNKIDDQISCDNGYRVNENGVYKVYLNRKLLDHEFVTVLIHELLHCIKQENGIPGLIYRSPLSRYEMLNP